MDEATFELERRRVEEYESCQRKLTATRDFLGVLEAGGKPYVLIQDHCGITVTVHDGRSTHTTISNFVDMVSLKETVVELLKINETELLERLAEI